jgi:membrane protease YdiL (CAAX protease family)
VDEGEMSTGVRDRRAIWLALAGLVLAWGMPEARLPSLIAPGDALGARLAREALWWGFGAIMLLWVTQVERRPLASIGLGRPRWSTLGWGLAFVVPMIASVMLSYAVILPALGLHQDMATTRSIIAVPLWLQCATMVRAGVVEEILYRGYPIERLQGLAGRVWPAAIVSALAFVAAHWGWAPSQLVVVAFGAAIMTSLYVWRRDLPACMIAHMLTDLVGFGLARAQS